MTYVNELVPETINVKVKHDHLLVMLLLELSKFEKWRVLAVQIVRWLIIILGA